MEHVVDDIHFPLLVVPGSLGDSHPPMQSTVYRCRKEPGTHVWTVFGKLKLKYAFSYLSGFAIADRVV